MSGIVAPGDAHETRRAWWWWLLVVTAAGAIAAGIVLIVAGGASSRPILECKTPWGGVPWYDRAGFMLVGIGLLCAAVVAAAYGIDGSRARDARQLAWCAAGIIALIGIICLVQGTFAEVCNRIPSE
jgi:hypothetical protein